MLEARGESKASTKREEEFSGTERQGTRDSAKEKKGY